MTDNSKYPEEGDKMDNNFGTADILTGRGLGLGGFGYGGGYGGMGGGGYGGMQNGYANVSTLQHGQDNHAAQFDAGLTRVSDQNEETRRLNSFDNIRDGQFQGELRSSDRLRDIEREMASNARVSDKCCCDTQKTIAETACITQKAIADAAKDAAACCCDAKLEACKSHAEIMATVIKENSATRELITASALQVALAENTQLKTIAALGNSHPHC